jgi:predicted permease
MVSPPRLARALLRLVVPKHDRTFVVQDLDEEFAVLAAEGRSDRYLRRWYWGQVRSSMLPSLKRPRVPPLRRRTWSDIMHSVIHDVRYAFRTLFKQPAYALTVIGMLTLGIAGNTAIFSVFNGLFLRPLPFANPDQLVNFDETAPRWDLEYVGMAYPDFDAWREHNQSFQDMAVVDDQSFAVSLQGEAQRVDGAAVTHDMASVLRIRPALGRFFTPEEDRPDGEQVVMLGHGLWQREFGGETDILGNTLNLDGGPYTIIGVLPEEAAFVNDADLWIPLATDVTERTGSWYLDGIGRLKPGVTVEAALEDLTRIHKNMIEDRPVNEITSPVVLPVLERFLGEYRLGTTAMLGAVGMVLLIACANIAGLTLARSIARSREVGIRLAMGAQRRRIAQQLLTESLVLAAAGALPGLALGYAGTTAMMAMMPDLLPSWITFDIDYRVVLFTLSLTMGAALVFGLMPALQASNSNVQGVLHASSGRSTETALKRRSLSVLVVGEIALALVLLIVTGLSVLDVRALLNVDPGFTTENVLTYRIGLPRERYEESEQRLAFFNAHLEEIRALPGVQAAGAATARPLGGHWGNFFEIEGAPPLGPDEQNPVILNRVVSPGYLDAIGVTLLAGRDFTENDGRSEGALAVIVNETFARRFWPDADPIGKRMRYPGDDVPWMTVVGVTHDTKHYGLDTPMRPGVFQPYPQRAAETMAIVVRSSVDPLSLANSVRRLVQARDPELPVDDVTTMSAALDESLWARRAASWLAAIFSVVALLMAVGGIYGVISYGVSQRTHEISIRMALGARGGQVLRHVMRQGSLLVSAGVVLGLGGAYAAAHAISPALFGVDPGDLRVYGVVTLILGAVTLLANFLPARRAAGLDPMSGLRGE